MHQVQICTPPRISQHQNNPNPEPGPGSFQTQPWKHNSASAVDTDPSGWTLGQQTGNVHRLTHEASNKGFLGKRQCWVTLAEEDSLI